MTAVYSSAVSTNHEEFWVVIQRNLGKYSWSSSSIPVPQTWYLAVTPSIFLISHNCLARHAVCYRLQPFSSRCKCNQVVKW